MDVSRGQSEGKSIAAQDCVESASLSGVQPDSHTRFASTVQSPTAKEWGHGSTLAELQFVSKGWTIDKNWFVSVCLGLFQSVSASF